MYRRRYLGAVGGIPVGYTGLAAAERGGSSDSTSQSENLAPISVDDWRHVNVVEYGADPTGEEGVTPVLEQIIDENGGDELVVLFPPGTYRMERGFEHDAFRDFGVFGYNATIEVSSDFEGAGVYDDKVFALGPSTSYGGHNVYVGGFEFDFRNVRGATDVAASAVATYGSGTVVFEHLRTRNRPANGRRMIELIAVGDCRGRIHDCVVVGAPGAGIYVEPDDRATVTVTDCLVVDCDDNGFYCSSGSGRVVIESSTAVNNDISNIRLGGIVRDSDVYVTDPGRSNARGFWLREGDCRVENCFGYNDADDSRSTLEIAPSAQSVTVSGSRFGSDSDRRIAVVNESTEDNEHSVTFRKCAFFGEKSANSTEDAITVARDRTSFLECVCSLTGTVYPIRFGHGAEDCRVIGGRYVSERPITFTSGQGGLVSDVELVTDHPTGQLDVQIPDVVVENVAGEISEDVRTLVNGIGDNGTTDPATDGDWNENGREGVLVVWQDTDADEDRMSLYRNGEWYSWSVE